MNPALGQNDGDASNHHGNLTSTTQFHLGVPLAGANCQLVPHINFGNEASVHRISISARWKTTDISYEQFKQFYLLAYNIKYSTESKQMFWGNLSPLSSVSNKPINKPV
jgi:hypothetical protein